MAFSITNKSRKIALENLVKILMIITFVFVGGACSSSELGGLSFFSTDFVADFSPFLAGIFGIFGILKARNMELV
jgi:hypothetical protein